MPFLEVVVLAVSMAMDAFAVCLAVGSKPEVQGARPAFRLAFHFGLFQFLMPIAGWLAGATIAPLIKDVDHWIAFGLLAFVGLRMIHAALGGEEYRIPDPSRGWTLVALSVAVSIDALAVGLSLGLLGLSVISPAVVIGLITGGLSVIGLRLAAGVGTRLGRPFEFVGGLLLIGIGMRILIEHMAGG